MTIERASSWAGHPPALSSVQAHRADLNAYLINTMGALAATGQALTFIGNDLLATDEAALERHGALVAPFASGPAPNQRLAGLPGHQTHRSAVWRTPRSA